MNLPKVVSALVKAQDNYDSIAYANCFSETAVVVDEGKTYNGKKEIKSWIAGANEKYKTIMKPIAFETQGAVCVLSAEISGTFDGSPVILEYCFEIIDGLIQSLKITG